MDIWFVGKELIINNKEIGWMPEACYKTEQEAQEAAHCDEFIVVGTIGERLPEKAIDACKLYYPKKEKWEDSKLYKIKQENKKKI